jgi:hypothetical protein
MQTHNYFNIGTQFSHILNILWTDEYKLKTIYGRLFSEIITVRESVYLGETRNPKTWKAIISRKELNQSIEGRRVTQKNPKRIKSIY